MVLLTNVAPNDASPTHTIFLHDHGLIACKIA